MLPDKDVAPDKNIDDDFIKLASSLGMTVAELDAGGDIPMADLAWKFALG